MGNKLGAALEALQVCREYEGTPVLLGKLLAALPFGDPVGWRLGSMLAIGGFVPGAELLLGATQGAAHSSSLEGNLHGAPHCTHASSRSSCA